MKRIVLVLILASGCGTARRGLPASDAVTVQGEAELGERVFFRECHECHPYGEGGLAPALNNKPLPGWAIRLQVRQGVGMMPAFSDEELSDAELDAVIAYLKVLRRAD